MIKEMLRIDHIGEVMAVQIYKHQLKQIHGEKSKVLKVI